MRNRFFGILASLLGVISLGCDKADSPQPQPGPGNMDTGTYQILIGNEGGFTYGNASLQVYDPANEQLQNDVFQTANGRPLGDVLQDVRLIDGRMYAVLNNSNRVEVIDTSDFKVIGSITGLASPRYILSISERKCYVTDFLAEAIHIIDPVQFQKTGVISLPGWTEELIMVDQTVWVTNRESEFIYLIDPATDEVVDSVAVAYGSGAIGQDGAGFIWTYCVGDVAEQRAGGLYRINPETRTVVQSFDLPADGGLFPRLAFDADRDTLFFLQDGVRVLDTEATSLPSGAYLAADGHMWYSLGYDPYYHELWVGDARDYQRSGDVYRYDRQGQLVGQLKGGIIPAIFRVLE